jgi:hypothetical protein
MRCKFQLAVAVLLSVTAGPLCAAGINERSADLQNIQALEARASAAQPREQCFLYAELVHQMTELSLKEYASGNIEHANGMLKRIQQLAQKIHFAMDGNDKRLKNAEILLRRTAFRLNDLLHGSSSEDRPLVEETLAQINEVQGQAMMQVLRK